MRWSIRESGLTDHAVPTGTLSDDSASDKDAFGRRVKVMSPSRQAIRRFSRHRLAMTGLVAFIIISLMAIFAPLVTQYDPNLIVLKDRNQGPSMDHWFGTDRTGRDVYARVVYAGRVSILVGVAAVAISVIIAVTLGSLAGFFGGKIDMIGQSQDSVRAGNGIRDGSKGNRRAYTPHHRVSRPA
jgi:ABC-type microcin C transport system permease subunit YejE